MTNRSATRPLLACALGALMLSAPGCVRSSESRFRRHLMTVIEPLPPDHDRLAVYVDAEPVTRLSGALPIEP